MYRNNTVRTKVTLTALSTAEALTYARLFYPKRKWSSELSTMAISLATPRHVFGASVSCFAGALAYTDNQAIIYPAGSCLIAYNIDQREQRIVMGSEHSRPVTALAITPNRRFVAVAEMGIADSETDRASIVVYDVQALSLIHIWRCRRSTLCRSRWSPYH